MTELLGGGAVGGARPTSFRRRLIIVVVLTFVSALVAPTRASAATSLTVRCGPRPAGGTAICVHYTTDPADANAVSPADHNSNGVPDYVDLVLSTVEYVEATYLGAGYRPPLPSSRSVLGVPQTDVVLQDVGAQHYYGYCQATTAPTAAAPTVPAYCVLDNDYARAQFPTGTQQTNLDVTAAHEFFHAVQYAYDATEDAWLREATAVWMEERVYDAINDNRQYLFAGPMGTPSTSLDMAGPTARAHEYGSWIFFAFLARLFPATQGGIPTIVREIWTRAAASGSTNLSSLPALRSVLAAHGTTLPKVLARFAQANRTPYGSYDEGSAYVPTPVTALTLKPGSVNPAGRSRVVNHLAWWTWRFVPSNLGARGWRLRLKLDLPPVRRGAMATVTVYPRSGGRSTSTVRLSSLGDAVVDRPFSSASVKAVELTLLDTSTRLRCGQGSPYACRGTPLDNGLRYFLDPRAYRR
jgi:hypothetical protein